MNREVFTTADGSKSFKVPEWEEQYHSKYGAIQEAEHVFIKNGLTYYLGNFDKNNAAAVLEIGFGTGLNALLTAIYAQEHQKIIHYTGLEAYPITPKECEALNYGDLIKNNGVQNIFESLHQASWEKEEKISAFFTLHKRNLYFEQFKDEQQYDLIYFDAFGARVQPELWNEKVFRAMYKGLHNTGVLVTYSAKGSVRRALQTVGFSVEKIPGPPGKREMLRACKKR